MHIILTIFVTVPMLLVALLWQSEAATFALPQDEVFSGERVILGPQPGSLDYNGDDDKTGRIELIPLLIFVGALLFYFFGFVELITHYMLEAGNKAEIADVLETNETPDRYKMLSKARKTVLMA